MNMPLFPLWYYSLIPHGSRATTIITPADKTALLQDEPDNRILECAEDPNAALGVTEDKHLLAMKEFDGIGTARIAGFLHVFGPEDKFRR